MFVEKYDANVCIDLLQLKWCCVWWLQEYFPQH